jgi:hypothetical protein
VDPSREEILDPDSGEGRTSNGKGNRKGNSAKRRKIEMGKPQQTGGGRLAATAKPA